MGESGNSATICLNCSRRVSLMRPLHRRRRTPSQGPGRAPRPCARVLGLMAMKKKTSPKKAPASTKAGKAKAKGKAAAAKKPVAKKAPAKKSLARKKPAKKKLPAGLAPVPAGPPENPRAQA